LVNFEIVVAQSPFEGDRVRALGVLFALMWAVWSGGFLAGHVSDHDSEADLARVALV